MLTASYRKFLSLTVPALPVSSKLHLPLTVAVVIAVGVLLVWLPLKLAALLVGGLILGGLALLEPTLLLYALVPMIPFSSLVALPVSEAKAGVMELLLLAAVAIWLLKLLTGQAVRGQPLTIRQGPLLVPFLVLLGGVMLSWLNALSIRACLIETMKWAEALALYLLVINLLPPRRIKWMALVILLTGVAQAALGLYQFVFKVGPDGFLLFGGQFLRAYGTFAQPNPYGGYLGLALPLALSLVIWIAFETTPKSVIWAAAGPAYLNRLAQLGYSLGRLVLFGLPLAAMLAALFASQSRGAWLGFAVAGAVTVVVRSKKFALLALAAVVTGVLAALAGSISFSPGSTTQEADSPILAVTERFVNAAAIFDIKDVATTPVTDANFATVERLAHWQAARDMWRDHPWLGVGFGNYGVIYPAYAVGRWLDPLGHAHNYLLNLGAETGLVGIIVYLAFWISCFAVSWRAVRLSSGFFRAVAAGGMGILAHIQVHNLVDNLYVQGMYLHVAIILGLISVIYLTNKRV